MLLLTLASALMAPAIASADPMWKLYDLRDLIGLLPPPTMQRADNDEEYDATAADSLNSLVQQFTEIGGLDVTQHFPGVYGVQGEESDHAILVKKFDQIRSLYAEQYEVEILWHSIGTEEAPAMGDPLTPTAESHRHRLVVSRRTPTQIVAVTQFSCVTGIEPVVATQAVAYGTTIDHQESGLRATVLVGAGPESAEKTSLSLTGELRRATPGKTWTPFDTGELRNVAVNLPEIDLRSIQSRVTLDFAKFTTIAVVDGFQPGLSIVIAASVRKLGD